MKSIKILIEWKDGSSKEWTLNGLGWLMLMGSVRAMVWPKINGRFDEIKRVTVDCL